MCEATERSSILVFLLFSVPILGAATSCSHETAESPQKLSSGGKAEERRGLVAKIRSCAEITTKSVVRGNTKVYPNIRTGYAIRAGRGTSQESDGSCVNPSGCNSFLKRKISPLL